MEISAWTRDFIFPFIFSLSFVILLVRNVQIFLPCASYYSISPQHRQHHSYFNSHNLRSSVLDLQMNWSMHMCSFMSDFYLVWCHWEIPILSISEVHSFLLSRFHFINMKIHPILFWQALGLASSGQKKFCSLGFTSLLWFAKRPWAESSLQDVPLSHRTTNECFLLSKA